MEGEANKAGDKSLKEGDGDVGSGSAGSGLAAPGVSRELSEGRCFLTVGEVRWFVAERNQCSTLASAE